MSDIERFNLYTHDWCIEMRTQNGGPWVKYEDHVAVLAAAPVAAPVQEWQDISTAPKDGTRILMGWGGMVVLGYWIDNSHTQWPWMGWKFEGMKALNGKPTHWMPLPALRAISGDTSNG